VLLCASAVLGQTPQAPAVRPNGPATTSTGAAISSSEPMAPQSTGSISGTVVDPSGTAISGARIKLERGNGSAVQEAVTDEGGQFFFVNVPPGQYRLTITAEGFAPQTVSGTLHPDEAYAVPRIALEVEGVMTQVRVTPAQAAEVQLKAEEKQRVLGVVPNFYVTYVPNAAPLNAKQKFQLAWKSVIDPVTVVSVAGTAGIQQATNYLSGYGQGAQGYGERFGASYADAAIGSFIGAAVLPSLLKQDPRYFYKGKGSRGSRFLYAIANSVICKGDNGRWQPNYSSILGGLAAGGIANLYYPPQNRDDAAVTFEGAAIGVGATAGGNLLQEFLVPKLKWKRDSHSAAPRQ